MISMTDLRLATRSPEKASYLVTIDRDGARVEYTFDVALRTIGDDLMMVGQIPRQAYLDFEDFELEPLPGHRDGGALLIPLLSRVVHSVLRAEQGWSICLPMVLEWTLSTSDSANPVAVAEGHRDLHEQAERPEAVLLLPQKDEDDGIEQLAYRFAGTATIRGVEAGHVSASVSGRRIRCHIEPGRSYQRLLVQFEPLTSLTEAARVLRDLCERINPVAMLFVDRAPLGERNVDREEARLEAQDAEGLLRRGFVLTYLNDELAMHIPKDCNLGTLEELGSRVGRLFFRDRDPGRWRWG